MDKHGHLLANEIKDKSAQIHLIEEALKDAGAALWGPSLLASRVGGPVLAQEAGG